VKSEAAPLRPSISDGPFDVQVGAFHSKAEALSRLSQVSARSGALVANKSTRTLRFKKGLTTYYRARFAGFTKRDATATCRQLKKRNIDCLVMSAN